LAGVVDLIVILALAASVTLVFAALLRLSDFAVRRFSSLSGLAEIWFEMMQTNPQAVVLASAVAMLAFVIAILGPIHWYFISMESSSGQTVGKRWLGLRVVANDTGRPPSRAQALKREVARWLVDYGPVPVGALMVLVHPEGKRLGDLWAGTTVIKDLRTPRSQKVPRPKGT
jgi:uncharacterized RDD family membrane protein YckC